MKLTSKGQALLLVIAAMTVALALGINVSMRTLQSISRTSRTDTSERILAAAEGGIERTLKLSAGVLSGGINNASDCALMGTGASIISGDCVVSFQTAGDPIIARATVVVSDFTYNFPASNTYKFKVEQDSVTEVNVDSASSLEICWSPVTKSDLYYIIYGDSGILSKKGLRAGGSDTPAYTPHNFTTANSGGIKRYCSGSLSLPAGSKGLRIKSIGGDSTVEVISATLPLQGHKIVSTGSLTTDATTKKVISVYKSLPFLPSMFDFGIFTQGALLN
jgi:hypothetical protein